MTRLIGAKSWLRGRSCALPTLDRRRRMPAQPSGFWRGNGRVFSWFFFFHGMFALDSNFPRLHWAWLCCRNYSRRPCPVRVRAIVCAACPKGFWGEEMPCSWCIFQWPDKFGPIWDPTKTPTSAGASGARGVIATVNYDASLVLSIALAGAGSSTLTNIYLC